MSNHCFLLEQQGWLGSKRQSQLSPNSEQTPPCLDTDLAKMQPKHHCPNVAIPASEVCARHMPHYHNDQQLLVNIQKSTVKLSTFSILFSGSVPCACHSHAAAVVGQRMFISGGTQDYQHTFSGLHAVDLATGTWQAVKPQGGGPSSPSCFSHSMTAVGALLVVAGGCHTLGAGLPHNTSSMHKLMRL